MASALCRFPLPAIALTLWPDGRARSPQPEPAKRKRAALYAEITPEARRQPRILAAEQDTRIEALVAEAVNLLFERHGKSPAA